MENPIGLNGIEFVEYSSPDSEQLPKLFKSFAFEEQGKHLTKEIRLFRQGDINFLLNLEPGSFAKEFSQKHGPCISAMGWRVADAQKAFEASVERGARPVCADALKDYDFPAIYGIGDSIIYFVQSYEGNEPYRRDFEITEEIPPRGFGFTKVDHLTNNVPVGDMEKWKKFYETVFNFREVRFFDIRGLKTGLVSKVMKSPCDKIIIPINEPTEKASQIQEYIDEYKGSGVQHIALLTSDIGKSVAQLRENKVNFLEVPDTYYEALGERVPNVTEPIPRLRDLKILVDGDDDGYLLQIFTQNQIGPIFFEIIQRKNHDGFGEGNFQALFDAIERDQERRGVI